MKTILVVDDDEQVRITLSKILGRSGYRVIEASSGVAALGMARQHLPDLILSDIHMPGGDGPSLVQELRNDPELRSKQIVLMTGQPELVTPRKSMDEGADDFLVKPFEMKTLLNCVEARFRRALISWRVEDHMLAQLRSSVPPNLPHEFFTPMAGIVGLMEILRGESSFSAAELKDIHEDVFQSALRLNRTLRNYLLILDLDASSEGMSGRLSPPQTEEAIRLGVREALRLNQRQHDLTIKISPFPIAMKAGDLSRVVEELIDNACKFSRQGTPIGIELEDNGTLTVSDKGRGMTPEEISSIGAFQQFDRQKNAQPGLGLGLVLIQKLAAIHQVGFLIQSVPGEGTRVQMRFPVAS